MKCRGYIYICENLDPDSIYCGGCGSRSAIEVNVGVREIEEHFDIVYIAALDFGIMRMI